MSLLNNLVKNKTAQRAAGALGLTSGIVYLYSNSDVFGGYGYLIVVFVIAFFALGGFK